MRFLSNIIHYGQTHYLKRYSLITIASYLSVFCVCLLFSLYCIGIQHKKAENKRLIAEYCNFNDYRTVKTTSLNACIQYLFTLSDEYYNLVDKVDDDYSSYSKDTKETNTMLCAEIAHQFRENFNALLNNCSASFPFSHETLFSTFQDYGIRIKRIIDYSVENDYSSAFSLYLSINNRYKENCAYYLVNSLAPTVFEKGIYESLMSIAAHGDQDEFKDIVAYIDSRPNGRNEYDIAVSSARRTLEQRVSEKYAYEWDEMKSTSNGYPFYVGMRESQLNTTPLGKPDSIKLCRDFYKLQIRARSKIYEWKSTNEHGWYKVTVKYRKHNSNRADDYTDLPMDDGYVSDITWSSDKGQQSISYVDKRK